VEFLIGRAGYHQHIAHYGYFIEVSNLPRFQTIALIDAGARFILAFQRDYFATPVPHQEKKAGSDPLSC
jgi:hypothetical protein